MELVGARRALPPEVGGGGRHRGRMVDRQPARGEAVGVEFESTEACRIDHPIRDPQVREFDVCILMRE